MPQKHKAEEIVTKLRQVDVLLSQGRTVGEAVRSIGVIRSSRITSMDLLSRRKSNFDLICLYGCKYLSGVTQ
ncbi:hypothetical protein GGQ85_004236 [Nitrobacter vulgaris]|nr:hypothetical protein [Nitrobacter vulgaris]